MISVRSEKLMTLAEACGHEFFRNRKTGRPCHQATIHRLVQRGMENIHGEVVKLETTQGTRGRLTSMEAIERFAAALDGRTPTEVSAAGDQSADQALNKSSGWR